MMDFSKYKKFLDLVIPDKFGPEDGCDEGESICDVINQLPRDKYNYECGATQFVIIADDLDYVVKIPFCGCWCYPYNEDTDSHDYDADMVFESFTRYQDYCGRSMDIFNAADYCGVGDAFAETIFLGNCKSGYPIYLQEKITATLVEDVIERTPSKDSLQKVNSMDPYSRGEFPRNWLAIAIDNYGEQFVKKLIEFCDNNVEDLHYGNIGFRKNGTAVIIDYAGYYEGF